MGGCRLPLRLCLSDRPHQGDGATPTMVRAIRKAPYGHVVGQCRTSARPAGRAGLARPTVRRRSIAQGLHLQTTVRTSIQSGKSWQRACRLKRESSHSGFFCESRATRLTSRRRLAGNPGTRYLQFSSFNGDPWDVQNRDQRRAADFRMNGDHNGNFATPSHPEAQRR